MEYEGIERASIIFNGRDLGTGDKLKNEGERKKDCAILFSTVLVDIKEILLNLQEALSFIVTLQQKKDSVGYQESKSVGVDIGKGEAVGVNRVVKKEENGNIRTLRILINGEEVQSSVDWDMMKNEIEQDMVMVEEKQIDIVDNVRRQDFQCVICGEKLRGGNLQLHMSQHKEYDGCLMKDSIPIIDNKGNEKTVAKISHEFKNNVMEGKAENRGCFLPQESEVVSKHLKRLFELSRNGNTVDELIDYIIDEIEGGNTIVDLTIFDNKITYGHKDSAGHIVQKVLNFSGLCENEQIKKTYTPPNTIVDDWIANGDNL